MPEPARLAKLAALDLAVRPSINSMLAASFLESSQANAQELGRFLFGINEQGLEHLRGYG